MNGYRELELPRVDIDMNENVLTFRQRNLNFQSLEVVYRYRDPHLQVSENLCCV